LTFLRDIVPLNEAVLLTLYYIAIILFGFTILIGFVAHYISSRLIMAIINKIEQNDYTIKDSDWIRYRGTEAESLMRNFRLCLHYCLHKSQIKNPTTLITSTGRVLK